MWESLIGGLCVAIPAVFSTIMSNRVNKKLIVYRIDLLDKKVQEYNNLKDRMYKAEKDIAVIKTEIKEKGD